MDSYEIERMKNIAENGRCFMTILALVNLFTHHAFLALLSALPIAAAIFVDMMPTSTVTEFRRRRDASVTVYAFAAVITFISFINLW